MLSFESSMIIALFALAVLMIVGGIASVLQGFPYVRLESGLAMVIAGATVASGGAVLLGIAALATRLRAVERALEDARIPGAAFETLPQRAMAATRINPRVSEPLPEDDTPATGHSPAVVGTAALAASASPSPRSEPVFEAPAAQEPASPAEPLLPDLLPAADEPAPRPAPAPPPDAERHDEGQAVAGEADLSAPPENGKAAHVADEPLALRPSLSETPDTPQPEPASPPPETAPQVVGTYASGGNTYVMFADGSIEAETPRGRYNFNSLDELKAFVEAGGEAESRGAA